PLSHRWLSGAEATGILYPKSRILAYTMPTFEQLRTLALSFPEVTEEPHFEKTSFRVKKKIFATFDAEHNRACVKLSAIDQDVFSAFDNTIMYPIPNKWGKLGWTFIELKKVHKDMLKDAVTTAYCEVAPAKLAQQVVK
ncbi:MAG: MmcQ/YjbR family DNA-binding protein, partial [Bacteroidota bacterium]